MDKKKTGSHTAATIVGVIFLVLGLIGLIGDFGIGFGSALIITEAGMQFKSRKVQEGTSYSRSADTEIYNDRYVYTRSQAWTAAGTVFCTAGALGIVVLKIMELDIYASYFGMGIATLMSLYWISYAVILRKS